MSLIERYVKEVERHLPRRLRTDVTRELRSSIEDSVDARAGGREADRETAAGEVLREYGAPKAIAQSYLPERYLIGPRYYDSFWTTTKVTLLILAGLVALGLGVDLVTGGNSLRDILWLLVEAAGEFPGTAVTFFGIIVVVFVVIERVSAGSARDTGAVEWDPATLPEVTDTSRINRASHAIDACFYVGLLLFFNFFRDRIGVFNHTNGEWWFMPLYGPDFGSHLAWLNVWWLVSLGTTVAILRTGQWTTWTRGAKTLLAAALAIILFRMATDPNLTGLPPGWPSSFSELEPYQVEMAETVVPVLGKLVRAGIGIAAIVVTFGVIGKVYGAVRLRV